MNTAMEKAHLLEMTNELYRLTLLFPKKEPLRYKMREVADEILANCLRWNLKQGSEKIFSGYKMDTATPKIGINDLIGELEVLDGFFELVRAQNWVKSADLLTLQQKYQKLKEELKGNSTLNLTFKPKIEKKETEKIVAKETIGVGAEARQKKILEILREKGRAQVWEIKEIFPGISKRTLRRDFESLLKRGMVERIGERNNTFYRLKIEKA